ncbi:MAG: Hpt domain-containing protein [Dehalococcoidia bacterium]
MLQFDATDGDLVLFLDEAADQLRTLSDGLLQMERDVADAQVLQAVFRAAHTLKGSSATIGHARMASLTHAMESVLDAVRNAALAVTADVIDALLACVDVLHVLNEEVVTRVAADIDVEAVVARLSTVTRAGPAAAEAAAPAVALTADEHGAIESQIRDGQQALDVQVEISPVCDWPAVRAYQALMELAGLGTVVRSEPSEADLESGDGGRTLRAVVLSAAAPHQVRAVVEGVTDVTAVVVTPLALVGEADGPAEVPAAAVATAAPTAGDAAPADDQPAVGPQHGSQARMVKVDIARLDALMNLVGELVIDRGRLLQVLTELNAETASVAAVEHLTEITEHLSRVSDDLQNQVMLSRLLPVESVFNRVPPHDPRPLLPQRQAGALRHGGAGDGPGPVGDRRDRRPAAPPASQCGRSRR